jgi:PPOX class probable F420-dependent enzyme
MLLTTFRRDGTAVATPVWLTPLDGDDVGFYTSSASGKVKRLAHTDRVTVQPCDARGRVRQGTSPIDARARVVAGPELERIRAGIVAKYGFMTKVAKVGAKLGGAIKRKPFPYADRGVVVTPSQSL